VCNNSSSEDTWEGLIPPWVGKDCFRHHDEMEIASRMAEQQRRDGRGVFCLQSGKRTLGLVRAFHNGRTLPIISVSAIHGRLLGEHGYQTDAMGRGRERERARGHCLGHEGPQFTGDKKKAVRGEAFTHMVWIDSTQMGNRDRALKLER